MFPRAKFLLAKKNVSSRILSNKCSSTKHINKTRIIPTADANGIQCEFTFISETVRLKQKMSSPQTVQPDIVVYDITL